jgi:hypothetical protein
MPTLVHYLPILTTLVAAAFSVVLYRHARRKPEALYLAWWTFGVVAYGVGTLTESLTTLFGWDPWVFRAWYVSGALLGGFPLAQGTVYLLLRRRTAHVLTAVLGAFIATAAVLVFLSPLDAAAVEPHRLSGRVLAWTWVRAFSPFVNLYAVVFLVGGAAYSAWRYRKAGTAHRQRVRGNALIALGAVLPGIGGTATRAGYVEVLYVTELVGLLLIWAGYRLMAGDRSRSIHHNQRAVPAVRAAA